MYNSFGCTKNKQLLNDNLEEPSKHIWAWLASTQWFHLYNSLQGDILVEYEKFPWLKINHGYTTSETKNTWTST